MKTLSRPGADGVAAPRDGSHGTGPRIAFISHTADWVGPTNSLTLLLLRLKDRYRTKVFLPGEGDFTDRLEAEGIDYESFRTLDKWDLLRLRRALVEWNADLVYANNTHSSSRIGLLASRLAGIPFVTHVRGMAWTQGWRRMGYLRFADRVVAVSQACADSVRRFAGDERLTTVHNGIPPERVGSDPRAGERIRQELELDPERLVIASVSHVMPRKGQREGLEAFAALAAEVPEACWIIAGRTDRDPAYVEALEESIRERSLSDRVRILGFRRDVADILDASDIFLHTAGQDPHPRSVIEAMARGLPVVAFAVDGIAETVVDEETGILASPGDVAALASGLEALAESGDLRAEMGRAARQRTRRHFTDQATAEGVAEVIDAVLAERRRPA